MITVLIYGALAASASLLLEILFLPGAFAGLAIFVAGAVIEEGLKLFFLLQWQKRAPSPPSPLRSFLVPLCFGIGFAGVEIALALPPMISVTLSLAGIHIATSFIIARAILSSESRKYIRFFWLGIAISIHIAYNMFFASLQ